MGGAYLTILQPGGVTLPSNIKTVALVNRALPQNDKYNKAEGLLTGEGLKQDQRGMQEIFEAMNRTLSQSPTLQPKLTNIEMKGSGDGTTFPPALSWADVDRICNQYNADAILALETYDSDCITTNAQVNGTKVGTNGTNITVPQFNVEQTVVIKYGFRIYNKASRSISDQFVNSYSTKWTASGNTLNEAMASVMNRSRAINQTCYTVGEWYARRISPNWVRVNRSYFKRGSNQLKIAGRKAMVNDWAGAENHWKASTTSSSSKIAGRACYNMALACEIRGDLVEAKNWAVKAYTNYNLRKAREYARILDNRIYQQQQMNR